MKNNGQFIVAPPDPKKDNKGAIYFVLFIVALIIIFGIIAAETN